MTKMEIDESSLKDGFGHNEDYIASGGTYSLRESRVGSPPHSPRSTSSAAVFEESVASDLCDSDDLYFVDKEDKDLREVSFLVAANPELADLPFCSWDMSIPEIAENMIKLDYEKEFFWSLDTSWRFMEELFYEGFVPIGCQIKAKGLKRKRCITLLKLHRERNVLIPKDVHISKNSRKRSRHLILTVDKRFSEVVRLCNQTHRNSWIFPPIEKGLNEIYHNSQIVKAHSIEVWKDGVLVGGEIGVAVGTWYTSITGFHLEDSAGSIQLSALGKLLDKSGFDIWDLGMSMDYKVALGAKAVPRVHFLSLFRVARTKESPRLHTPDMGINCRSLIDGCELPDVHREEATI